MTLTELYFTSDNPSQTQIYNGAETDIFKIIYEVRPVQENNRMYTIVERAGSELARLEWHDSTPDIVIWSRKDKPPGLTTGPTRMYNWMKPSIVPFIQFVSFFLFITNRMTKSTSVQEVSRMTKGGSINGNTVDLEK